jgi:hypothetical protein
MSQAVEDRIVMTGTGERWQQAETADGDRICGFQHWGWTVVDKNGRMIMAHSEPGWDLSATIERVMRYRATETEGGGEIPCPDSTLMSTSMFNSASRASGVSIPTDASLPSS